jgi:hypothetical protein
VNCGPFSGTGSGESGRHPPPENRRITGGSQPYQGDGGGAWSGWELLPFSGTGSTGSGRQVRPENRWITAGRAPLPVGGTTAEVDALRGGHFRAGYSIAPRQAGQ